MPPVIQFSHCSDDCETKRRNACEMIVSASHHEPAPIATPAMATKACAWPLMSEPTPDAASTAAKAPRVSGLNSVMAKLDSM